MFHNCTTVIHGRYGFERHLRLATNPRFRQQPAAAAVDRDRGPRLARAHGRRLPTHAPHGRSRGFQLLQELYYVFNTINTTRGRWGTFVCDNISTMYIPHYDIDIIQVYVRMMPACLTVVFFTRKLQLRGNNNYVDEGSFLVFSPPQTLDN